MTKRCKCGCGELTPIIKDNNTARGYVKGEYHDYLPNHHGRVPVEKRLRQRIVFSPDGRWAWTGYSHNGIAQIHHDGRPHMAARVMYEIVRGAIPPGIHVCHKCDNPLCTRPSHLFLGTTQQNQADKVRKGRQARGSKHGKSKLSEKIVEVARSRHRAGEALTSIARDYDVAVPTIRNAVLGRTWKHVGS